MSYDHLTISLPCYHRMDAHCKFKVLVLQTELDSFDVYVSRVSGKHSLGAGNRTLRPLAG